MASVVAPMNSSFSARLSAWPSTASTSFNTSKCSGSLSMSTPSMSKMTASKRLAKDRPDRQYQRGAGAGQGHEQRAGAGATVVRLRQQVTGANRQKYARKHAQQGSQHDVVESGERADCRAQRGRKRIQQQQHARPGQATTTRKRQRHHVHPVGEIVGQDRQADEQAD